MKISKYANSVEPSLARTLFNMAKQYNDVIDLTLGDPDFDTPEPIKKAACMAIEQGLIHYSANAGLREARVAIANHIKRNWGLVANPDSELIVTVGGMEGLFLGLASIVDPGDEVIVFAPYYVNYVQMVRFLGGIPVILDSYDEDKGIVLDEKKLCSAISERTVAVIVNSPNNPTGAVFSSKMLNLVARVAQENDLLIISDEVYRSLLFDGRKHESIFDYVDNQEQVLLIDSLSKEFCMTGWRVGYAFGNSVIIGNMIKLQENVAACAPLPSQYALIEAYSNYQENYSVLEQFQRRRDVLYDAINSIPKLHCIRPQGTFYMFVNIEQTGLDSLAFAEGLLRTEHVAVVPGETYGDSYNGYIRIAFTKDTFVLRLAAEKLARYVSGI